MTEILVGIGVSIVGLFLVFRGYAFARILLTVWGLMFGVVLGGSLLDQYMSSGFLNTAFSITLSIILGLIFATSAYFFFYVAFVFAGAALGFYLGSHFLQLFGVDPNFLTAMLGITAGVIFGIAFIVLNLPRAYLIVVTAFSGAVFTIGGLLLVSKQIPLDYFCYQTAKLAVRYSVFWSMGSFVLAFCGIVVQSMRSPKTEIYGWQAANKAVRAKTSDEE